MSKINYEEQMSMQCKECILANQEELKTMSASQFARQYNLNYHAVLYWLDKLNIKHAKYGNLNGKRVGKSTNTIIALLKKGTMTYQQIADKNGVSRQYVGAVAKEYGIPHKSKREIYLERLRSDKNLCNMNAREISKKHDIPYNTVLDLLSSEGLSYARWNRPLLSDKDYNRLLSDLESQKYSYQKLADKYKVSLNWVVSVAKKHHLTVGELSKEGNKHEKT